ncbi:MAG: class I SAM-dependent methyltransferase [Actinobacteria bacterium]|nr:class I SAM-dependent methyltransferase [Actinomycetota bacterium]
MTAVRPTSDRDHWQAVYRDRDPRRVSWFEESPRVSLEMIEEARLPKEAAIIDAGGGTSSLAAELLDRGYSDITVADISAAAIDPAKADLSPRDDQISWVVTDLRNADLGRRFALWHDRAVFHFMVVDADRDAYLESVRRSLHPEGHLILATFAADGPDECSGLPTRRYGIEELVGLLDDFDLVRSLPVIHETPSGSEQRFLYAHFRRRPSPGAS